MKRQVNQAETETELEALRRCVHSGQLLGSERWVLSEKKSEDRTVD